MTNAVNEVMPTGMFATPPAAAGAAKPADKDMFLKLMVTQMRNQDPMNPTDSSQFLAQTAQFTALEKMEDVANQTAQMVSTQMAFGASSLVGRAVTYLDANGATVPGTVKGVNFGANGPELDVDGVSVLLAAVQSVTSGSTGATPTQGTGTTTGTTPGTTPGTGTTTGTTPGTTPGTGTTPGATSSATPGSPSTTPGTGTAS